MNNSFLKKTGVLLCLYLNALTISSQITVNLPCISELDAVIGLDRKDWNNGSTAAHSQGYLMNFTMPSATFGPCKKIQKVDIAITVNNVDETAVPADCNIFGYFTNIAIGCANTNPATCPNASYVQEVMGFPVTNTFTITCPPNSISFGDNIVFDIIPAMSDVSCSTGQTMISAGSVSLDFNVCVTITIVDQIFSGSAFLGADLEICEGTTTMIGPTNGLLFNWSPNNQMTQFIDVGAGNYEVTVTDSNGCTDTDDIIIVEVTPSVTISNIDPDNIVCANETTILTAQGNPTNGFINWSTNAVSTTILVGEGTYTVTITDLNLCTATDQVIITEHPVPNITLFPLNPEACGNSSTTVTANPGFIEYDWGNGITGQVVELDTGNYILTITDNNLCTNTSTITVDLIPPPNAGLDDTLKICNLSNVYNIDSLLGTHDMGGIWNDIDTIGLDLNNNSDSVSFMTVIKDTFNFSYHLDGALACPSDTALITVVILDSPNPGMSLDTLICNNVQTINFESLMSPFDLGGEWTDVSNSPLDINDINNIPIEGVMPGLYNFTYSFNDTSLCEEISSTLGIEIIEALTAGDDNMVSICSGTIYDLTNALSSTADLGGSFTDDNSSGALNINTFDTNGLSGNTYNFTYSIGSMTTCGVSTSIISVEVVDVVTAGQDNTHEVCIGQGILNLLDFLPGANNGGIFTNFDNAAGFSGNELDTDLVTAGIYNFQYNVGDGVICPKDSANFVLSVYNTPTLDIQAIPSLCLNECFESTLTFLASGTLTYSIIVFDESGNLSDTIAGANNQTTSTLTICNNGGAGIFNNDTLSVGDQYGTWSIGITAISDDNCDLDFSNNFIPVQFQVNESFESNISYQICTNASIIVNNVTYNIANPSGQEMVQTSTGCDSLINVDLSFFPVADSLIESTLCENESIIINNEVFDIDNPMGSFKLTDASVNGCDSMIIIDLAFNNTFDIAAQESICDGDSIFLENQWIFGAGTYIDNFMATTGCDSTITTELSIITCQLQITVASTNNLCGGTGTGSLSIDVVDLSEEITLEVMESTLGFSFITTIKNTDLPLLITDLFSGNYQINLFDMDNNLLNNSSQAIIDENPPLITTIDIVSGVLCNNGSDGVLSANTIGGAPTYDYNWNNMEVTMQITQVTPGNYTLSTTDANGCSTTSQISILNPDQISFDFFTIPPSCETATDGSTIITPGSGGMSPFTYLLNGISYTDSIVNNLPAGDYSLEIIDSNNCSVNDNFTLTAENQADFVVFDSPFSIKQGDSITLSGIALLQNLNFEWSDSLTLSCNDCLNPVASPTETTEYFLSVMNNEGCKETISVLVEVRLDLVRYYIPNIISADGDGINETFDIFSSKESDNSEYIFIYDRWGNLIYENVVSLGAGNGWDGRLNDKYLVSGVYVYKFVYSENGKTNIRKGDLTIIR